MSLAAKSYAVELDFRGRRRLTTARYDTRAEAQRACDRHAPLFVPRVVTVRSAVCNHRLPDCLAAFADTLTGSAP